MTRILWTSLPDIDPSRPDLASRFIRNASMEIANVRTTMALLDVDGHAFPVSINNGDEESDNSYVVSPLTAYTSYARYELARLQKPLLQFSISPLIAGMNRLLRDLRIDRLVQVNNWLLSTNVYPSSWTGESVTQITTDLVRRFPDHAIGFRSLNGITNAALLRRLKAEGYIAVPSRQVYFFDARNGATSPFLHRHNVKLDERLLRNSRYAIVPGKELGPADFSRLAELYQLLYRDKYSPLNPAFTATWLERGQRDGWLSLTALRSQQGTLDGVVGLFGTGDLLTAPVVGYDTSLPQSYGLYRLCTQLCLQAAVKQRCLLNFSSGAAGFKRLRGATASIEYSMVYVKHLPAARRALWATLARFSECLGVPILQKLRL